MTRKRTRKESDHIYQLYVPKTLWIRAQNKANGLGLPSLKAVIVQLLENWAPQNGEGKPEVTKTVTPRGIRKPRAQSPRLKVEPPPAEPAGNGPPDLENAF